MSILVYAEIQDGNLKKSSLEAISYAKAFSNGKSIIAIAIGTADTDKLLPLALYGADKILHVSSLHTFDSGNYATAIAEAANAEQAEWVLISNTYTGKSIAPRVAVKLKTGIAAGVVALPEVEGNGWKVKKSCFSGKGFAWVNLNSASKVISLTPNSYPLSESPTSAAVTNASTGASDANAQVKSIESKRASGKIPLTEAEIVVSGGRGLKGPENWGMIEELAQILGAATACSKPVSDMHWRTHDEHVGQTGITIKPNLYIASGISGAIQHQAGVSSSKVIVVINKDPEAPFFKIADYGIVGDVFEVLPKIIAAAKVFKSAQ
jgi:electron transfer flavoprotein alpha subunit